MTSLSVDIENKNQPEERISVLDSLGRLEKIETKLISVTSFDVLG